MTLTTDVPRELPIASWVEDARADPVGHRARQVTHILLSAVGLTPALKDTMLLKGGVLMMLGFASPRGTQDVDFTVEATPEPFATELVGLLNPALRGAAAALGYPDLLCRIQKVERRPRAEMFEGGIGPALKMTVAHARIGTNEVRRLEAGQATGVLQVDLSFKEPVFNSDEVRLEKPSVTIRTYALEDLVAEKFRALLQQPERNRERRQDVFDLAWIAQRAGNTLGEVERRKILDALMRKSAARGITPTSQSMDDPEVSRRAATRWSTLGAELPVDLLPPFDDTFAIASAFYRSLPWP